MLLIEFSLPLSNPVLIFSLFLFIILFSPIILNRFKIPPLIGLIIAGIIIGPNGLNFLLRDTSVILFGTVGLLYIMFLAGLEIDLAEFNKNKFKSIIFGAYTFIIPMFLGTVSCYYLLDYPLTSCILIASMFASHTLVTYPIVSKLGISKNSTVNITVGGTMITDTLALLVLAVIAGTAKGEVTEDFWVRLALSVLVFALIIIFIFPLIGRWFFKHFDDNISQYIFVLALVFLGAFLAEAAGIEAIIGAFLAGLALNRLVPHNSALMNRIDFVGNALFIPFFLIGVGMLIDFRVLFKGFEAIKVAVLMSVVAATAKYIAAFATQMSFKLKKEDRLLIFGLSNSQAAATLAAVLVGYNIITGYTDAGEPLRLLDDNVLNGTILMILVTCTIASFATQKAATIIASQIEPEEKKPVNSGEKFLVSLASEQTTEELVQLAVLMRDKKEKAPLYGLNIINSENEDPALKSKALKLLDQGAKAAASADYEFIPIVRYDLNIVSGISNVMKEHNIENLIMGLHRKSNLLDNFYGKITNNLMQKSDQAIYIFKPNQPLNTIRQFVVVIPVNSELEAGYHSWLQKIIMLAKNTGNKFIIYAGSYVIELMKKTDNIPPTISFVDFSDWSDFLIVSKDVQKDTMIIIVMARKNALSYNSNMERIPNYLKKYFSDNNFLLIFPAQKKGDHRASDYKGSSLAEPLKDLQTAGKKIKDIFFDD